MKEPIKTLLVSILFSVIIFSNNVYANLVEPYFATEYDLLQYGISVLAVDANYLWATGQNEEKGFGDILYRSDDYGYSWEKFYSFDKKIEAIHITYDDIILISTSDGRWLKEANCEIFRSNDGADTFNKVLDLESGAAVQWNIASDDEGYIFVSEYGYKALPDNSRRIYRSSNSGLEWEKVYEAEETLGYHNHVISIDKNDPNIIYQSIGDIDKKILQSSDRGVTWNEIISGYHPTSMLQIDSTILWGLDDHPKSGIIRYDLETKEVDWSFETPLPLGGSIYDLLYVNDVIYAGLLSYGEPIYNWDGSIFISRNKGLTWENFAIWPKYVNSGVGFYKFTTKGDYGFIWVTLPIMKDGTVETYRGTLRFKLIDNIIE